jgi:hypothetical protein
MKDAPHEIPYVPKKTATIVAVDDWSATALRATLEVYNYRVTTHWVGSRKELVMLLDGSLPLEDEFIILACHGDEQSIVIPGETQLTPQELGSVAKLQDKIVLSLGCKTGSPAFREAFVEAGARAYVAPTDYPDGSSALVFAAVFCYELSKGTSVSEATKKAASLDNETGMFGLSESS